MVKRPRAALDAHEVRTPQKRPRLEEPGPSQPSASRKSASTKRHHAGGSNGTPATPRSETGRRRWELTPEEMELQEAEFERLHEQKIQRQCERKQQRRAAGTVGAIAEHGVIESLELKNFMCHTHLALDFGPQCNFIIGHNGSGKSAVLSALTIALGGRAASTGRGGGMKSFIREGQQTAEVTVGIRNQGDEAFKPAEYGNVIYVTRSFTADGSFSYKIQNSQQRIVSRKRADLTDIIDHMNLQVDNPLTVLTQDSARHFLSSSRDRDKYEFFMKGTLLTQLAAEYDLIEEKIAHAQRFAEGGMEIMLELQQRRDATKARYDQAQKARTMHEEREVLKIELAWAHVAVKEDQHSEVAKKLSAARARARKTDTKLEELQQAHDHAEAMLRAAELELPDSDERRSIEDEKMQLAKQMKDIQTELREFANDQRLMNRDIVGHKKRIEELDQKIAAEARKLARDSNAAVTAIKARLTAAETARATAVQQHTEAKEKRLEQEALTAASAGAGLARKTMKELDESISRCQSQQANGLAVYGNNIKNVIQAIRDEQWAGRSAPIGPLGLFVELKDKQWANVLRIYLGKTMMSFAVSDVRDRQRLKKILNDTDNRDTSIIIAPIDIFDFRKGEPAEGVLTILRALKIENPWALRIFINAHKIEQTGLCKTRKQADDLLGHTKLQFAVSSEDLSIVRAYSDGGRNTQRLPDLARNDPRCTLFVGGSQDLAAELRRARDERKSAEIRVREMEDLEKQSVSTQKKATASVEKLKEHETRISREVSKLAAQCTAIEDEKKLAEPVSVAGFETAKSEEESRKADVLKQFVDSERQANERRERLLPLQKRIEEIQQELEVQDAELVDIKARITEALEEHMRSAKRVDALQAKRDGDQTELDDLQETMATLDHELAEWTETAVRIAPKVKNPRAIKTVETKLQSLSKTLAQHERDQGGTVDQINEEMVSAEAKYKRVKKFYRDLSKLVEEAEAGLETRREKWFDFLMFMSLRCKMQFAWHLSTRGFFGKVHLKHVTRELRLEVRPENRPDKQVAATIDPKALIGGGKSVATDPKALGKSLATDPKALSGGEKSFATICFLLALWDCLGSPMRCLDEFDVFMDAVNRKVTMRIMMDAANEADQRQFILISPQSLTGLKLLPSVKVLRMRDPERGEDDQ
ncbi:P-loop containing nucleoside triphosphate hydrolase protein [Auriculariales sp. MPI-PUGE-AT-0066]|nr:P-loop containing nucleoside triphosphate hydrolase protein [Auriculariales sp. MPI-PUGE-AT-0066]